MKNPLQQIDRNTLRMLEPLNRLSTVLLDELVAKSVVEEVPAGRTIARCGEKDPRHVYLLSGQVEVAATGQSGINVVKAKTPHKTPIAAKSPRPTSLKAKKHSTLLYIDSALLELSMCDETKLTPSYEVTEIGVDDSCDSDDWMLTFLQSPAFSKIPNDNISKLLANLDEFSVKKGQVIIKQGDVDDNYYIIKSGTCNVHRKPSKDSANVLLAVLTSGNGFGEEALISNGSRNATITMCENGQLMRLRKDDFLNLLINPVITYFNHSEIEQKRDEGGIIIDVRSEQQAKNKPLANSVNIPLNMLRMKFDSLNAEREYLLMCDDGSQSAAAAFLMIQGGLVKCSVLEGGLNNAKGVKNNNPKPTEKPKLAAAAPVSATKTIPKSSTTPLELELVPQAELELAPIKEQNSEAASAVEKAILEQKIVEQYAEEQEQVQAKNIQAEQSISRRNKELEASRASIERKNQQVTSAEKHASQLKTKASQELARAQAENKANQRQLKETDKKMQHAEEIVKKSETIAKQTRNKAEKEAQALKQKALKEAKDLYAEKSAKLSAKVQAEREVIKLHQQKTDKAMRDAEKLMKQSEAIANQTKKKAEKEAALIVQRAQKEAKQWQSEKDAQESANLQAEQENQKLHQQKNNRVMRRAEQLMKQSEVNAEKTRIKAEREAALIKQRATSEAKTLRAEVEAARKKIQQDAAQFKEREEQIKHDANEIRRKALKAAKQAQLEVKKTRALFNKKIQQAEDEKAKQPPLVKTKAKTKTKAKAKKEKKIQQPAVKAPLENASKIVSLSEDDNLIIFTEPSVIAPISNTNLNHQITHRTQAESKLTEISTGEFEIPAAEEPPQKTKAKTENKPFPKQKKSYTESSHGIRQFDQQSYTQKPYIKKSNTPAIAASFLLIICAAVITLHATDTLKVQSIAAIFNSGNDSAPTTAIAKTKGLRKNILRADKSGNIKKKITDKMESVMQSWNDLLDNSKNPKKSQRN